MKRNRYTAEFRQQVVREAQEVGNTSQVARRHELSPNLVYRWMKDTKHKKFQLVAQEAKSVPAFTPTAKEFETLEQQNEKLKKLLGEKDLENDILRDLVKKLDPAYRTKLR